MNKKQKETNRTKIVQDIEQRQYRILQDVSDPELLCPYETKFMQKIFDILQEP